MSREAKLAELDRTILERDAAVLARVEAFEVEITAELEGLRALIGEANALHSTLIGGHPCGSARGALAGTVAGRPLWGKDGLPQLVEGLRDLRRRQAREKREADHAAEIAAAREREQQAAAEREERNRKRMNDPEMLALFRARR